MRVGAREITISHAGAEVARHGRLHGKFGTSALLDHYLELLARTGRNRTNRSQDVGLVAGGEDVEQAERSRCAGARRVPAG